VREIASLDGATDMSVVIIIIKAEIHHMALQRPDDLEEVF